ncbi:MAG TPA: hypothetical protein VLL52_11250 [Anaerolineae bacterium]|nr:hypothetical protein [Anaerolineae bacterium]
MKKLIALLLLPLVLLACGGGSTAEPVVRDGTAELVVYLSPT